MESFEWSVPDRFNIASYALGRWTNRDNGHVAVYIEHGDGSHTEHTFGQMQRDTNRFASRRPRMS